jgi:hypothetical protein
MDDEVMKNCIREIPTADSLSLCSSPVNAMRQLDRADRGNCQIEFSMS